MGTARKAWAVLGYNPPDKVLKELIPAFGEQFCGTRVAQNPFDGGRQLGDSGRVGTGLPLVLEIERPVGASFGLGHEVAVVPENQVCPVVEILGHGSDPRGMSRYSIEAIRHSSPESGAKTTASPRWRLAFQDATLAPMAVSRRVCRGANSACLTIFGVFTIIGPLLGNSRQSSAPHGRIKRRGKRICRVSDGGREMEFANIVAQEPTVSQGSSYDLKEQVRQAIDIVDLVGGFIQLRRQGRNYVGLCPWHDDSRPSLQVNPERQSWKCWVCDVGGDVFSFLMQTEGITFPEALAMLAERAGIALKPARRSSLSSPSEEDESQGPDKRTLLRAMAWAEQQYHECLLHLPEGEPGRKYLADREITAESIEKFHLGYSPDSWDWISRRAEAVHANVRLLENVGILVRSAGGGRSYDRYRGRVLFSIRDTQGRPVGLGGRVLPEAAATTPAKYVNSPETPLFRKSALLYGLDVAREAVRKSHSVLVMEGYTDCIVAHQYGFANTVAVLGTALGEGHIKILKRFADRIILVLDGDEAGQKRANEVLELFVAQQVDLRIVTLAEEKDPCDYLLKHGADAFRDLIENQAVDALEHAFQTATKGVDLERDVHGATQALDHLIEIVAKAPRHRDDTTREARLREEKILQRLAARFRMEESQIRSQVTELRRKQGLSPARSFEHAGDDTEPHVEERGPIDPWERELLEIVIQHPGRLPRVQEMIEPEQIASPVCRRIYRTCCELVDAGVLPTFERLMLEFDDARTKSLLVALDEEGRAKASRVADPAALLEAWIAGYQQRQTQRHRPAQNVALREGQMDEDQQLELLQKIVQQERARQGISKPTDG